MLNLQLMIQLYNHKKLHPRALKFKNEMIKITIKKVQYKFYLKLPYLENILSLP